MTKDILELVKKLRTETGAGIMESKKALEETGGDLAKAKKILEKKGLAKAEKKADRETKEGYIATYTHSTGKVGVILQLLCETDFVARSEEFRALAKDLCLQIAAMKPRNLKELRAQEYIREPEKKIGDLLKAAIAKFGENIRVGRFNRFEI